MEEIIALSVKLIFACISVVLTAVVIPWLKEKRLYTWVKTAVQAAEKLAESQQITKETKKAYVIDFLENKGIKVTYEVDVLIESCVEELDYLRETILKKA